MKPVHRSRKKPSADNIPLKSLHRHSTQNHSWSLPNKLRLAQDIYPTTINLLDYDSGKVIERLALSPDDCRPYLNNSSSISWFDVTGLGNLDILQQISEIFGLDPYLLEDIINVPHRPKVEEFSGLLSIITQMAVIQTDSYISCI